MNLLVATNHLRVTGGTEVYTYALVKELMRQGHSVEYYCVPSEVGDFAHRMEQDLGVRFKSQSSYDLILANHPPIVSRLFLQGMVVQTCHGTLSELEQPSKYAFAHVAVSEAVKSHLATKGYRSTVILNGIDCVRFAPTRPLSERLTTVLSLCQGERAKAMVKEACEQLQLTHLHASKMDNNVFEIEQLINQADMVVGIGRSLYDSMACGRAAVSFDSRRYTLGGLPVGDGYLTPENLPQALQDNCVGRSSGVEVTLPQLIAELQRYQAADGVVLRQFALEHLNIEHAVTTYLAIYQKQRTRYKFIKPWQKLIYGIKLFNARLRGRVPRYAQA